MSETNESADKPTQGRKPLSLQRTVESGHVQQKFGQGRSKSVVVEKKRTAQNGGTVDRRWRGQSGGQGPGAVRGWGGWSVCRGPLEGRDGSACSGPCGGASASRRR